VNVREIIETAATTAITQLREKNLRLDLDIADDLPALSLSRHALHQIMAHLIGNACQASDSNGRVAINAHADAITAPADNGHPEIVNFIHLSVTDSGEGIGVDDRARVFDPQYRADHPLIAGIGDTGAGLAVARTLSENNGGRIWVDSQEGVGSTFSVLFPIVTLPNEDKAENGETNGHELDVD
jgi:signal transduction histidine kinase